MLNVNDIVVNSKLKDNIFSRIPKNYSNLEKAIFIYYELCKTLNYSISYLLGGTRATNWFTNIDNIKKVDGEKCKDVVCFTFNAIYAKLLIEAGICNESVLDNISVENNKQFSTKHLPLIINIDGFKYVVDSSNGVFDNNDLTLSKYSTHQLCGWKSETLLNSEATKALNRQLTNAIETVQSDNKNLDMFVESYINLKLLDNSYENVSLDEKVNIFLSAVNCCPYNILAFNYLLKLKRKLFSNCEFGKIEDFANIDLFFGRNIETNNLDAFLFYNPKGYLAEYGLENFDTLQIYQISLKNKHVRPLTIEAFKRKIRHCLDITRGTVRQDYTNGMISLGRLNLKEIYERGSHKKEMVGYLRTLLNGETRILSVEEGEKLKQQYYLEFVPTKKNLKAKK